MDLATSAAAKRRALRRAVELPCDLVSRYLDEPLLYWATDLSPFGLWLETPLPMQLGEQVVLSFQPAVWWPTREITVFAEVVRVTNGRRSPRTGMGLEFLDLDENEERSLGAWLRGRPPPLPRRRKRS
jgi:hypothetical protein